MAIVTLGFSGTSLVIAVDAAVLKGGGVWDPLGCMSPVSETRSVSSGETDTLKRLWENVGLANSVSISDVGRLIHQRTLQ